MPPIDPLQLLKALAPLLASNGGMKSSEEVVRLSSLMKKFSRKLVSRCVYVNVLASTPTHVLESFLAEGGWDTINMWLQESKKTDNFPFILELLRLFRTLPMTVERLKENNSAKLVKSFTKSEHVDIKIAAQNLVEDWMKLVKGEGSGSVNISEKSLKRKKKNRDNKSSPEDKKETSQNKDSKENAEKRNSTLQVHKSTDRKKASDKVDGKVKNSSNDEMDLEDVKLPAYLEKELTTKKSKIDRPKTVKTYRTKFRSTGLEEVSLPPKSGLKKHSPVDKAAALAAKNAVKRLGAPINRDSHSSEKRHKPTNLVISDTEKPGIKLIPPKPKPIHVIKESAGFMDALVGEPAFPTKKKKRASRSPTTTTPPPTPVVTPKLQFYKDTLDTSEKSEENCQDSNEQMDVDNCEVQDENNSIKDTKSENDQESNSTSLSPKEEENKINDADKVLIKKPAKKNKTVTWADETQLRQIHYFELDETERVNVNNIKNFGDMKTLDRMNERHAVETARRMMGDKMDEKIGWLAPILIDLPTALVERGCNSSQREIQRSREQSILQEIYFSKDSVPDSPHEPEPEIVEPQDPITIPLEDENNPDSVMDYSMLEMPQTTSLPPALSNLVLSLNNKTGSGSFDEYRDDNADMYYKNAPPGVMPPPPGMHGPPSGNHFGPFGKYLPGADGMMPMPPMEDGVEYHGYFDNSAGLPPMPSQMGPRMRMPGQQLRGRGGMGPVRGRIGGNGNGGGTQSQRGPNSRCRGGPHQRGRGQRSLCRHFQNGSCKFEESCMFLHPGVNGPMI